jgi:hypothetical protein
MTFKDLRRLVQSNGNGESNEMLHRLKDKPFWIGTSRNTDNTDKKISQKRMCGINHIFGLPQKDGHDRLV